MRRRASVSFSFAFNGQNHITHAHIRPPAALKDGHCRETARAHGHVRKLVGRAVGVDGEQVRTRLVDTAKDQRRADLSLVPSRAMSRFGECQIATHWKSICLSMVMAVTTRGLRPVVSPWSSMLDEMRAVVNSVSAAVPAPQQRIESVM